MLSNLASIRYRGRHHVPDFLTAYLRHVVHLQGLAHGDAAVQAALDDALLQLQRTTSFYFDSAMEIAP
ncbi:hypothetical protein SRABI70_02387 [Pseudomonas sp. Bi70]|uniref:hypothetical protein n=1 Tax=Pseudomonas sp. Bi70 TaxID=2821127 RepID=UPI001D3CB6F5|nr:hypothetical protein [Pseudomonas sp. Bi70]CAH0227484.1 hypothetical protein SRABI70_02387 [Pseudomonas sp. Bi70]